jgi:hypothetical protein
MVIYMFKKGCCNFSASGSNELTYNRIKTNKIIYNPFDFTQILMKEYIVSYKVQIKKMNKQRSNLSLLKVKEQKTISIRKKSMKIQSLRPNLKNL